MYKSRLRSTGICVPKKVVTNQDLEKLMDTSDEWIQQRSGIKERRWIGEGETTLSMAVEASKQAMQNAEVQADDIDAIVFGCLVSDYIFPGTGCLLQRELGFSKTVPALDIRNQCSGFLYGLSVADAWIRAGFYKRVLLVGSEIHSTSLDKSTRGRDISVLFGDGAGAVIVERSDKDDQYILGTAIHSEGQYAEKLTLPKPSSNDLDKYGALIRGEDEARNFYPFMDGKFVFKNAVRRMPEALKEVCDQHSIALENIDCVIPHQANIRINQMILEGLGIPLEKSHHTIHKYGNTTMASIPLTLHDAIQAGKVKEGDTLALIAFGAGFTWGASLVKF